MNPARIWRLVFAVAALPAALGLGLLVAGREAPGLLFVGALLFVAGPILRRVAPREPALLKTLLFTLLFSPPLVALVWMFVEPGNSRRELVLGLLVLVLIGGAVDRGTGRALGHEGSDPIGRAGIGAASLGLGFALVVALALFQGAAARASFHGLLHSSILESVSHGVPPENPWLAGEPLGYYWVWHALGAALGELLGWAPTLALAGLNVWAAATLPLSLYFFGAPLWQRGKIDLVTVGLGLLGLNLLGGFVWLASGAPFAVPETALELLANLRGLVPGGMDPRLAWGPSKFGNLSSYPAALALFSGGLVAAGHALEKVQGDRNALVTSSQRVWSGLAAVALGLSALLNPLVGAAGFLGAGLVALFSHRPRFLFVLVLSAGPALLEVLWANSRRRESGIGFSFSAEALVGPLFALAPLLVGALVVAVLARPKQTGPRAFFHLAWAGALSSFLIAVCVRLPEQNEYKFVRTAAFFLAPLAAGAPFVLLARGGALRMLGAILGGGFLLGAVTSGTLGAGSYAAWSRVSMALSEQNGVLLPIGEDALSSAMRELRELAKSSSVQPVLVVEPPPAGAPGWKYDETRFGGAYNLQGHEAAAFGGMALLADRQSYITDADPVWPERLSLVRGVYAGVPGAIDALSKVLEGPNLAQRPHYLLSLGSRPPKALLAPSGWQLLWSQAGVRIYVLES